MAYHLNIGGQLAAGEKKFRSAKYNIGQIIEIILTGRLFISVCDENGDLQIYRQSYKKRGQGVSNKNQNH